MWKSAIVLQGPYHNTHTPVVIHEFLVRNKSSLIIIATYLTADIIHSEPEGEGRVVYIFVNPPPITDTAFWETNFWNQNLQRLTSYAGMKFAHDISIPVALKCRTDAFLGKPEICDYLFENFLSIPIVPLPGHEASKQKGRIITSDHTKPQNEERRLQSVDAHHVADYWLFGYTSDLVKYFDTTSDSSWKGGEGMLMDTSPESNLAGVWMNDVGIPQSITCEELMARYMGIASSVEVEFVWLKKWHNLETYKTEGKLYLTAVYDHENAYCGLLTHELWKASLMK